MLFDPEVAKISAKTIHLPYSATKSCPTTKKCSKIIENAWFPCGFLYFGPGMDPFKPSPAQGISLSFKGFWEELFN